MRAAAIGILTLVMGTGFFASVIAGNEAEGNSTGVGLSTSVSPKTETIHIVRDTKKSALETRTYKLKHADPYIIAQILREALSTVGRRGPRDNSDLRKNFKRNPVVVTPLKYEDGTGAVIVTAPKSVFQSEDNDKHTGLDNIIKQIDQTDAKRVKDSIIHYQPQNKSASQLSKIVENMFQKERVIISMDPKSNDLLIAGPPSAIRNAVDFLKKIDIAPRNYLIKYRILVVKLDKSIKAATETNDDVMWIGTDFKCSLKDFDTMLKEKKAIGIMSGSLAVSSKKSMIINTDNVESGDGTLSPGCSMEALITRPNPEVIEFNLTSTVVSDAKESLKNDESHVVVKLVVDGDESRAVIGGGILSATDSARLWLRRAFGVSDFGTSMKFQMVLIVSCKKEQS